MLSKEMQEKLMGEIKRRDKFIELIGIKIIEADEGYCKAELKVDDRTFEPAGNGAWRMPVHTGGYSRRFCCGLMWF